VDKQLSSFAFKSNLRRYKLDDCEDESIYPAARFVSEFGFQSHPSVPTYRSQLPFAAPGGAGGAGAAGGAGGEEAHLVNGSEFLAFRQRHPDGDAQMTRQLRRRFAVPPDTPFPTYAYLTQVQQARCYDTAIRKWRRGAGGAGAARGTMGVLYWQLNDVWAGPTWSSMDGPGGWRRKLLHHAVRRAYAPLALSVKRVEAGAGGCADGGGSCGATAAAAAAAELIEVWSTCECGSGAADGGGGGGGGGGGSSAAGGSGTMTIDAVQWSTGAVLHSTAVAPFVSHRFDSVMVWRGAAAELLTAKCAPGECFLVMSATLVFTAPPGSAASAAPLHSCSAEAEYFPGGFGTGGARLPPAAVTVTHFALESPTVARVVLEASHPAAFVRPEVPAEGSWSDSGFLLRPGRPASLTFTAAAPIASVGGGDDFLASLTVTSLVDALSGRAV